MTTGSFRVRERLYQSLSENVRTVSNRLSSSSVFLLNTSDRHGWPKAGCSFPSWFSRSSWIDAIGFRRYQLSPGTDVAVFERRHSANEHTGDIETVVYGMTCLSIESNTTQHVNDESMPSAANNSLRTVTDVTIIAHTVQQWLVDLRCDIVQNFICPTHLSSDRYDSREISMGQITWSPSRSLLVVVCAACL